MQNKTKNRRLRQKKEEGGLTKEQQITKDSENLKQLLQMPDFQVIDFFQNLSKSSFQQQVLQRIPRQSKIRFFSDHFHTFLQTQEELLNLQLPQLDQIPKIKQLIFERVKKQQKQQNFDESTVLQIIDSFSSAVVQQNTEQIKKLYKMIQQMKKHTKYNKYFDNFSLNKILLENYNSMLQNCTDTEILLLIGQNTTAIQYYMNTKTEQILQKIRTNLNINDSGASLGKQMSILVAQMHKEITLFLKKFTGTQGVDIYVTQWIIKVIKEFYQLVEPYIYSKEQLSDILGALVMMIQRASDMETHGVCFQRQFKELVAQDLPSHISKIIQIIVQIINSVLRDDQKVYEFIYIKSVHSFASQLEQLKQVDKKDFSKKCASNKGIILVNSFVLILSSLCDEKWQFLHESAVNILIEKIALNILASSLLIWDYYHIYTFFERLSQGRVRHLILFKSEINQGLKEKIQRIKKMAEESWKMFQQAVINLFWKQVLIHVPMMLWNFKKHSELPNPSQMRPTSFSLQTVFRVQDFIKQFKYRITPIQLQHIGILLYDFLLYITQYAIYWSYHAKGTNEKIFFLSKKNQKQFIKVKAFAVQQIFIDKQKVLKLSYFTVPGLMRFGFELHFITEAMKTHGLKVEADKYLARFAQVFAKEHGIEPIKLDRSQFSKPLDKLVEIYKTKPQSMRNFVNEKRKSFFEN